MFSKLHNFPVSNMLQIFDIKILPIITYGAELWGDDPRERVNGVYNNFHKYVPGIPYKSVKVVALGELGRPSIRYHVILKMILYWLRLIKHPRNRYTMRCYQEQMRLADAEHKSWGYNIKLILGTTGFGYVWNNQGVESECEFISMFKQRLLDIDRQNWSNEINSMDIFRTYKIFKTESYVEPYTFYLDNFCHRRAIARFRCGSLNIAINEDRKKGISLEQRLCKFCDTNDIDDEIHFLLRCPTLSDIRTEYIPQLLINNGITMMSECNETACKSISQFIVKALKIRSETEMLHDFR